MIRQSTYPPSLDEPAELWRTTLFELRLQMTKATFNTWLADSFILASASTPVFWVIVVRNEYAWEWLTYRLCPVIERTILGLVQNSITICFVPRAMRRGDRESTQRSPSRICFDLR